jgi:hypothetical protein
MIVIASLPWPPCRADGGRGHRGHAVDRRLHLAKCPGVATAFAANRQVKIGVAVGGSPPRVPGKPHHASRPTCGCNRASARPTDPLDLPQHTRAYVIRDIEYLQRVAAGQGQPVGAYTANLLDSYHL